jgi:osmotically inducible protein OsmC
MALSLVLGSAGFTPDYIDAASHVTVTPQRGGFKITKSQSVCEAKVPGLDRAVFVAHAETAKALPCSQAFTGSAITLEATLAAE